MRGFDQDPWEKYRQDIVKYLGDDMRGIYVRPDILGKNTVNNLDD